MGGLDSIADEMVISILSYLRAIDLASVKEANKTIFSSFRIAAAVRILLDSNQPASVAATYKKQLCLASALNRPDSLYVFEVISALNALSQPAPLPGKGYWVSASWLSNAKKYLESLPLPELEGSGSAAGNTPKKAKRRTKPRQSRGTDLSVPSSAMASDLRCQHGQLCLTSSSARRRAIDSRAWAALRRYHPDGPEFKCSAIECELCTEGQADARISAAERREAELQVRRQALLPPSLQALWERKQGVPEHCIYKRWAFLDDEEHLPVDVQGATEDFAQPLLPGLYNLVPRDWLRYWRRYVKDASMEGFPLLDCAGLMCYGHGLLVVPPHLEEYLLGVRRSLVSGLGQYQGEVVELVSAEEWDELQRITKGMADFGVRCCLDGQGVSWNTALCQKCDPFAFATFAGSNRDLVGKAVLPRSREAALV